MDTAEPLAAEGVRGMLHRPATSTHQGIVLTHGAGGNCSAPLLIALGSAFCDAGFHALRCDLPFRQRRPTGPPSPASSAADREGLRRAVAAMRRLVSGPVILGGQSYGGRQSTILAAESPGLVDRLLLLSYPLHPPGNPDRLRTEHFPGLRLPCVFVQGDADPFGSLAELRAAIALIPGATEIISVDRAGHDLRRGRFDLTRVLAACSPPPAG